MSLRARGRYLPGRDVEWSTWSGSHSCVVADRVAPRDVSEVVAAVSNATHRKLKVKAVGSGHSANDSALTDGVHVSLRNMKNVLAVNESAMTVRVQAGITLRELNRELRCRSLAIPSFGDIDGQTLGGAIATGTHGTGGAHQSLSAQIVALTVVTADGDVRTYSVDDDIVGFRAMALSVGALGIVVDVTLQCRSAFKLHQFAGQTSLTELETELEERIAAHAYFDILYDYRRGAVYTRTREVVLDDTPSTRGALRTVFDDYVVQGLYGRACSVARHDPAGLDARLAQLPGSSRVDCVGDSDRVMAAPQFVRLVSSEHALPRSEVVAALREFGDHARKHDLQSGYPLQVRFTADDPSLLSPAYGRPTAWVNSICIAPLPWRAFLDTAHGVFGRRGARPHWGKWHAFSATDLEPLYPEWSHFQEIRASVDPNGTFTNDHIERVLGPVR